MHGYFADNFKLFLHTKGKDSDTVFNQMSNMQRDGNKIR